MANNAIAGTRAARRHAQRVDVARAARLVFWNLILAVAYWVVARMSLAAATEHRVVASIWPPAGIAFFVLVRYGTHMWPGVALGAFVLNASSGISPLGSAVIALGDTLEAVVGATLVQRVVALRPALDRVRDIVALAGLAGLLSTLIAATIGVATLVMTGSTSTSSIVSLWLVWWSGDAVGVLVVAPLLLVWTTPEASDATRVQRTAESVVSFAAVALLTDLLFARWGMFIFAVYPLGMWLAWRYGPRGAATTVAIVTFVASVRTLSGYGPFATLSPTGSLFAVQLFLSLFAVKCLLFAASRAETQESNMRVRASETRYRMLAQHLPDGCVVLYDADLRLLLVEGPAVDAAGFVKEKLEGLTLDEVFDAEHMQRLSEPFLAAIRGRVVEFEFSYKQRAYLVRVLPLPGTGSPGTVAMALALDVTERDAAQREVVRGREQLERLSRLLLTAHEDERRRVAREVHDELGQALTAVKIGLATAMQRMQRRTSLESERHVRGAAATVDRAIDSVKRIILRLRPGVLDSLGPIAALEYEVQQFREHTKLRVTLELPPEPLAIDGTRSTALYRTVQEALTNVMRHAHAKRVDIALTESESALVLRITDDGCGIAEEQLRNPRSMGILGMRERAGACGGRLDLSRMDVGGTQLTLTLPHTAFNGVAT